MFTNIQYNVASLIFSWFALANLWLTFSIIIDLLPEQKIFVFGTLEVVSRSPSLIGDLLLMILCVTDTLY